MSEIELKSVYKRGAEMGVPFGGYLSAIFLLFVSAGGQSVLGFVAVVMMLCVPIVVFGMMRRAYVKECGTTSFSTLWMLGILIFIYGSLICSVVTYVWLQYVMPDFIYDQANAALALYKQIPEAKDLEIVSILETAIKQRVLPSSIQFVFQMIWMTTFFGSILSIFEALAIRMFKVKTQTN